MSTTSSITDNDTNNNNKNKDGGAFQKLTIQQPESNVIITAASSTSNSNNSNMEEMTSYEDNTPRHANVTTTVLHPSHTAAVAELKKKLGNSNNRSNKDHNSSEHHLLHHHKAKSPYYTSDASYYAHPSAQSSYPPPPHHQYHHFYSYPSASGSSDQGDHPMPPPPTYHAHPPPHHHHPAYLSPSAPPVYYAHPPSGYRFYSAPSASNSQDDDDEEEDDNNETASKASKSSSKSSTRHPYMHVPPAYYWHPAAHHPPHYAMAAHSHHMAAAYPPHHVHPSAYYSKSKRHTAESHEVDLSRTVSSSFGDSVNSKEKNRSGKSSVQVKEVKNENEKKRQQAESGKNVRGRTCSHDSKISSLASPTDNKDSPPPVLNTNSLDSLCDVASAQQPLAVDKKDGRRTSDGSERTFEGPGVADLMQCSTNSSNSLFSQKDEDDEEEKEERKKEKSGKNKRPHPSPDPPVVRYKASPLSISSNSPTSFGGGMLQIPIPVGMDRPVKSVPGGVMVYPVPAYPGADSFFLHKCGSNDESVASLHVKGEEGKVERPGSSTSSTDPGRLAVMPSWELQQGNSFEAVDQRMSLMPSFSFTNDGNGSLFGVPTPESRNQSHSRDDSSNSLVEDVRETDKKKSMINSNRSNPKSHPQAGLWGAPPYPYYHHPPPSAQPYYPLYPAGMQIPGAPPVMQRDDMDSPTRLDESYMAFQAPPSHINNRRQPVVVMHAGGRPNPRDQPVPTIMKTGVYSWNKDDDAKLTMVMKKYRNPVDWEPIAKEHGRGKSAKECHERWIRYLKPGVRKGQWQDYEDAIVVEAVTNSTEQPFTRWSELAQRLPGRVGKQVRDRWVNHLNPDINHMPFSKEDDQLLFKGFQDVGKRWVEISTKYFNNSRSENHIKNRWYSASFKKFIQTEYGSEVLRDINNGGKGGFAADDLDRSPMKKSRVEVVDRATVPNVAL